MAGGHDAALQGDSRFAAGFVDRAFWLDGDGDYIDVPDSSAFNFGTGAFTVDFWVRFNDTAGEQVLVEKYIQGFEGPSSGWTFTKLGDNAILLATASGEAAFAGPLDLPVGEWIHLAVRRSGADFAIFMNGEMIASAPSGEPPGDLDSTASLKFGHRGSPSDTPGSEDDSGFYLNGRIDEIEVFDRALAASEVREIWASGSAGKCKP